MADTTFCDPNMLNDSKVMKESREKWGPIQNVFTQTGVPTSPMELTPTRPKTVQDNYEEDKQDQDLLLNAIQRERIQRSRPKLRSITSHSDNFDHLKNVEYQPSDSSNSFKRLGVKKEVVRADPIQEFTRGIYLNEIEKQNQVLLKHGIKLDNRFKPLQQEHYQKQSVTAKLQPVTAPVPQQLQEPPTIVGHKIPMIPYSSPYLTYITSQPNGNNITVGGFNLEQYQQRAQLPQQQIQTDIMRVDPYYRNKQTSTMLPFNSLLQQQPPLRQDPFSLKDAMELSMQLASQHLSGQHIAPAQPVFQSPVISAPPSYQRPINYRVSAPVRQITHNQRQDVNNQQRRHSAAAQPRPRQNIRSITASQEERMKRIEILTQNLAISQH